MGSATEQKVNTPGAYTLQLGRSSWFGLAGRGEMDSKAPAPPWQKNQAGGEISALQKAKGPGKEGGVSLASQKLHRVTFCCFLLSCKKKPANVLNPLSSGSPFL